MDLARRVATTFRRSLWSLIAYEVLFRILLVTILSPVAVWALGRIVASSGRAAISNEAVAGFLLSPIGLLTLLGAGAITLGVLFAQRTGIMQVAYGTERGRWRPLGAVVTTIRLAPPLIRLGLLQFGLLVLAMLPFAAAAALTWWLLLSDHDINFYLATRPPRFRAALVIGAVLVGAAGLVAITLWLRWSLNVPIVLHEGRAGAALRESARLVRGRLRAVAGPLVLWAASVLGAGLVVAVGLDLLVRRVLDAVGDSLTLVIPIVASFVALQVASIFVWTFVWFNVHCLLTAELYATAGGARARSFVPKGDPSAVPPAIVTRHRAVLVTLGAVVIVLLVMTTLVSNRLVDRLEQSGSRHVTVTAHRGSSRAAPENSISAIEQAIRDGADLAEIDVQELRDGTIVVAHDTDLMRVTGLARPIWDIDYAELRTLDAGSWFSPEFAGERIPTLAEAIAAARGRLRLNIELKFHGRERALVERVVEIVEAESFVDQCVVTSLDYDGLLDVKRRNDAIDVGFIVSVWLGDLSRLDVDFLSLQRTLVTRRRVRLLHDHGIGVHVWTVNAPLGIRRMIAQGVDSLITDEPATAVSVGRELEDMAVVDRLLLEFRDEYLR